MVVADPDADRGRGDAVAGSFGRQLPEGQGIDDSGVGVTVGEQHHCRPSCRRDPAGLLQPAKVTRSQVGGTTRPQGSDRRTQLLFADVTDSARRHRDGGVVVEGHQAESVSVVEPVHKLSERALSGVQALTGHGAGPVQHHHCGVLHVRCGLVGRGRRRRLQFHHDGDGVVLLQCDDIELQMGVDVHCVPSPSIRLPADPGGTGSPSGCGQRLLRHAPTAIRQNCG